MGSLKCWYREAMKHLFWEKCLERFKKRDPDNEIPPQRPSRDANPSDEHRHQYNTRSSAAAAPPPPPRNQPPSPPRERRDPPRSNGNESREYDPEGVGHNIKDSLNIFGLERGAVWMDVKAELRRLSRLYHPD